MKLFKSFIGYQLAVYVVLAFAVTMLLPNLGPAHAQSVEGISVPAHAFHEVMISAPGFVPAPNVITVPPTAETPGAQIGWIDLKALLTPEVWAFLVLMFASQVTPPITTWFKQKFKTHGDMTKNVNTAITSILTGLLPFLLGLYGYTFQGFIYAVVVALLRAFFDQKNYEATQTASKKAARVVLAEAEINADHAPYNEAYGESDTTAPGRGNLPNGG